MIQNLILTTLALLTLNTKTTEQPKKIKRAENNSLTLTLNTFERNRKDNDKISAIKENGKTNNNYSEINYSNYAVLTTNGDPSNSQFKHLSVVNFSYYAGVLNNNTKLKYKITELGPKDNPITSDYFQAMIQSGGIQFSAYLTDDVGASNYLNEMYAWQTDNVNYNWWNAETFCNETTKINDSEITYEVISEDPQTSGQKLDEGIYLNINLPVLNIGSYYCFIKIILHQEVYDTWLGPNMAPTLNMYTERVQNIYTINPNISVNYEVIPLGELMLTILSMPFNFLSTAFNITL
ncbi:MAG: hypothetical protein SO148_06775, partial [Candidatus Onthovivens sp.]|nr:hypothetical protein [Candidatus Onthovivens sp.]